MNSRASYPLAVFGNLARREGRHFGTWRRRILCPNPSCQQRRRETGARGRRQVGWQTIRESLDPQDWSRVSGYRVEQIELGRELIPLPDTPDGTLSFGLPASGRHTPPTPGVPLPTPLHRAMPVLASIGDPYRVGRHASNRFRGPGPYWTPALSGERAALPFVVTCPDCRARCRVDGSLPEAELRRLTGLAQGALRE